MPVLRLFGPARLCAGTGRVDIPGVSVAEVLEEATRRFGPAFAEIATSSRWSRGNCRSAAWPFTHSRDEVAVLPPVSGG
jgi:hypothetical protein